MLKIHFKYLIYFRFFQTGVKTLLFYIIYLQQDILVQYYLQSYSLINIELLLLYRVCV